MSILIVLFTILLILDCLLLGLLVMVQLPKKEAGVGMAFGSGATDALFGAGSGTALSTLTSYSAAAFFVLVFGLSLLNNHMHHPGSSDFKRQFEKSGAMAPATTPTASTTVAVPSGSNATAIPLTIGSSSNTTAPVVAPPTNAPVAPAK